MLYRLGSFTATDRYSTQSQAKAKAEANARSRIPSVPPWKVSERVIRQDRYSKVHFSRSE